MGREYEGAIVSIRDFGAFVNIGVNTDGLLHISQVTLHTCRCSCLSFSCTQFISLPT